MYQKQKTFKLQTEPKTLIITSNQTQKMVKDIEKTLGIDAQNLSNDGVASIYTLGKIKSPKVIILNHEKLKEDDYHQEAMKKLAALKEDSLLLLDTFESNIDNLFEKLVKAFYRFNKFKTEDNHESYNMAYYSEKDYAEAIHRGIVIGEATNHTRELINTPSNYMSALDLAEYAKSLEAIDHVKVTIYDKTACEEMNMGAFLGVNKGSKIPPQLIYIEYTGHPKTKDKTALIGKGVMFDTGGYSLKTAQGMPSMKCDMGGAATVLGAIEAIARLKAKENVSVIIAATDNKIGEDAIVPDDILTAANGTTIEIISTDAEGRLTLADALWFAEKKGATRVIDVATLTGAVVGALGKEYTGAFTNDKGFLNQLLLTAQQSNEKIWELPISKGYHEALKSQYADIKNSGGRLAGASVAAAFLSKFVKETTPWIHLDIAGTSYDDKSGATGILVKTLTHLFI